MILDSFYMHLTWKHRIYTRWWFPASWNIFLLTSMIPHAYSYFFFFYFTGYSFSFSTTISSTWPKMLLLSKTSFTTHLHSIAPGYQQEILAFCVDNRYIYVYASQPPLPWRQVSRLKRVSICLLKMFTVGKTGRIYFICLSLPGENANDMQISF